MQTIKVNTHQIERNTLAEAKALSTFQPFVTELLKNSYSSPITIKTLTGLIHRGDIVAFLKREALLKTPEVNNMPITEEAKHNMIDVTKVFSNYFQITSLHATLPKDDKILRLIYSYDIDTNGKLFLSELAQQRIKDSYTLYATNEETEIYNKLNEALNTIEEVRQNTGFNLLRPGAIQPGEGGKTQINAELFLLTLKNRN